MELFKLLGTIAIENGEAIEALQDTSKEGEKTESKLSKVFSGIGKGAAACGKAIMTGLAVGATAMAGLTVKALQLSGDLEQNLGGAEAVFGELGDSIDKMSTTVITGYDKATGQAIASTSNLEKVSKDAYKNMGLSQSDYLATANKMGALFKGAGFETQEALDLSSQAMQRAADVASIMGLDTEAAMEAVAGAAKGNFTMMDNLGVAMNDTAIGAYALEKGINKSTSEMSQQEKIGLAMEMFLEKTSYAAGNYAKENETLAGSLSTAKSALSNFLAGSGDAESVVSSLSSLADVVMKNLGELVPRLTQGLTEIVNKIAPMLPDLLNQLLPVLIEGAVSLVNGLITALPGIITAIMNALPLLIQGVADLINALISALPGIVQALVDSLPALIPAIIDGIVSVIVTIAQNFTSIIQPLIDALPDIIITIVESLVNNLPALIEGWIQITMGIIQAIPQILQALVDAIPEIVSLLVQALLNNLPAIIMGLIQVVLGIVVALPQIFMSLIQAVPAALIGIIDGIGTVLMNIPGKIGEWLGAALPKVGAWAVDMVKKAGEMGKNFLTAVANFFTQLPGKIWGFLSDAASKISTWAVNIGKSALEAGKTFLTNIVNFFAQLPGKVWSFLKSTFTKVTSWVKDMGKKAIEAGKTFVTNIVNFFKELPGKIGSFLIDVISKVGSWVSSMASKASEAASKFFTNLWNGLKAIPGKVVSIGKDIVEGIWKGISNGLGWIKNKIKGWVGSVVKFCKKILGISSPSAVMRDEIGRWMVEGVAEGIEQNLDSVESASEKMAKTILDFAQKKLEEYETYNNLTLAGEVAFWDGVREQIEEGTDARLQADRKYLEAKEKLNKELADAEEELFDSLEEAYAKIEDRKKELIDHTGLFDAFEIDNNLDGGELFYTLNSQVQAMEMYGEELDKLKARIGDTDLYKEIEGMGIGALNKIRTLNGLSDYSLDYYMGMYDKRNALAGNIAQKQLSEETLAAEKEAVDKFNQACVDMGVEVPFSVEEVHKAFTEGASISNLALASMDEAIKETSAIVEESFAKMTEGAEKYVKAAATAAVATAAVTTAVAGASAGTGASNSSRLIPDIDFDIVSNSVAKVVSGAVSNKHSKKTSVGEFAKALWFDSAMDNPVILDNPTIFGYSNKSGKFLGAGESGDEVVAGATTLMQMIQNAVAEGSGNLEYYMQGILELLATFLPMQFEAFKNMHVKMNTGALVGEIVVPMDEALGKLSSRKDRGR